MRFCRLFIALTSSILLWNGFVAGSLSSSATQGLGMQLLGGSSQVIEAITQYQIMQMFQQQNLKEEDRAAINFYKPFIGYLNTLDELTRNKLFIEALSQPLKTDKLPLVAFCENAYSVALTNNVFTQEQQNKLRGDMAASLMEQANGVTNTNFSSFMKNALTAALS